MATGTTSPPRPAATGSASRRRSRSSPMSNSRRASRPKTKKKNVISPLFTHSRRSSDTPLPASRTDSRAPQTASYDDASMFTQASAASAMASSTAAPPVSVRRNSRSGVWRFRAHAVRPEKEFTAAGVPSSGTALSSRPAATSLNYGTYLTAVTSARQCPAARKGHASPSDRGMRAEPLAAC
jgi:hypothetical protein